MAFNIKPKKLSRSFYITFRWYCDEKSIYQREEEGKKPRTVHGKPYPDWRKPWIEREGEWSSKLSVFTTKNPSPYIMNALQNLPNITTKQIKDWWRDMKVVQQVQNQKFLPERVAVLGSNLAALHFFAYRRAALRLRNSTDWITGEMPQFEFPDKYEDGYFIEAIDCTNFHHGGIRYEGVQNFSGLNFLKWLSLKNNKHVDVWCLDRIAGQNGASLEYLDLSGIKLCIGSVMALARISALKMLVITEPGDDIPVQVALSMLELERPSIIIKTVDAEVNVTS